MISGLFDKKKYNLLAKKKARQYQNAKPFPHIQITNFLNNSIINKLQKKFPHYNNKRLWIDHKKFGRNINTNFKRANHDERFFPIIFREFIREANSRQFLLFLETISGIHGLIPDPYLVGGGLHVCKSGGYLNIHADFNWHHKLQLHRRLNVLIYLTPNWKEEFNGNLELWNKKKTRKIKEYSPKFNSCIIFNTTADSFHGHPIPVAGNKNTFRKVINLYYYTAQRPKKEIYNPTFTVYGKIKKTVIRSSKFKIQNSYFCNQILKDYKNFK
jgi:Rps23 Pro-64 3,4-dihydroxylase Tpa1-like proline 4-hydroxylase